jgi:hypothetical protein
MSSALHVLLCVAAAFAAKTPAPVIEAISPMTARAGAGDFILRVRGAGFTGSTALRWNGTDRVTAVIGPNTLTAMIVGADVAQPGEARVMVCEPETGCSAPVVVPVRASMGGGAASARADNPVPAVESFAPAWAAAGTKRATIVLKGQGFTPFSRVRWRGAARPTRFVSSTTLETELVSEDLSTPGWGAITVRNPIPGGGISAPRLFSVSATSRAELDRPRIYPNPWRAEVHQGLGVSFDNLAMRSHIKIFTVSGAWIKTIPADEGAGQWDLTNQSGQVVQPGAYIYLITDGRKTVEGKLKVLR